MKSRIVPTMREIVLQPEDVIISKTDLKGRITYANRAFMRVANYSARDLLSVQHNLVRHPDMPRGAFKLLWETLGSGREFFGYVKNMSANGDHYWVFANVTPDRNQDGKIVGYFSVRRRARPSAIAVVEPIYREMLAEEARAGAAHAPSASIRLLSDKLAAVGSTYDRFVLGI